MKRSASFLLYPALIVAGGGLWLALGAVAVGGRLALAGVLVSDAGKAARRRMRRCLGDTALRMLGWPGLDQACEAVRRGGEAIGIEEQEPAEICTTRILHRDGKTWLEVEACRSSAPGLAITRAGRVWQLTHEASGERVACGRSWPTPELADADVREHLLELDWTRSRSDLALDDEVWQAVRIVVLGTVA